MNKEIKVAKEAALEAGNLILSFYKADYEIRDKDWIDVGQMDKYKNFINKKI